MNQWPDIAVRQVACDPSLPPEEQFFLRNTLRSWGFFRPQEIAEAAERGELKMLDLDFGRRCALNCAHCFRKRNSVDANASPDLDFEEILAVVDQAIPLGLCTVKLCGAGEPLQQPGLLKFAKALQDRRIGLAILTKGHPVGDDLMAKQTFGHEGVNGGADLARRLYSLGVSLAVGFLSPDPAVEDQMVQRPGYSVWRNRALERLVAAGFTDELPTRLACVCAPVDARNISTAFAVYRWCRERGILPIIAALMVSGKQLTDEFLAGHDCSDEDKLRLFSEIYKYNLRNGMIDPSMMTPEWVSAMPGIAPCSQLGCGLYVTLKGEVVSCPGDTKSFGNVRTTKLDAIWRRSVNYNAFRGRPNVGCPWKDGRTLPSGLYQIIPTMVK